MESAEEINPPILGWIISALQTTVAIAAILTLILLILRWIATKAFGAPLIPKWALYFCFGSAVLSFALVMGIQSIRAFVSLF